MAVDDNAKGLRVGLTGGIASGKTVVAEYFAELGARVIDTDDIARETVAAGRPALAQIATEFGPGVLTPGGELDRQALRELIFDDPDQRRRLEAILHPLIRRETESRSASAEGPYQLIVVPLLIETDFSELVDRVLVVDCPEDVQRKRLLARDGESATRAERMIAAQITRSERLAAADDVIDNSGDLNATRIQVEALHRDYLKAAESS
jgi:dephospho-CoA kinase